MRLATTLFIVALIAVWTPSFRAEQEPAQAPNALPEADENSNGPSLRLGETLKLDDLGPTIINEDGTMRRITNWLELSKEEQLAAGRRLVQRNKERLAALKLKEQEQQQGGDKHTTAQQQGSQSTNSSNNDHGDDEDEGDSAPSPAMLALDAEYKDVVDFKQMSSSEKAEVVAKMSQEDKRAFALRVTAYHKAVQDVMQPEERADKEVKAKATLDAFDPKLRENLKTLLKQHKQRAQKAHDAADQGEREDAQTERTDTEAATDDAAQAPEVEAEVEVEAATAKAASAEEPEVGDAEGEDVEEGVEHSSRHDEL